MIFDKLGGYVEDSLSFHFDMHKKNIVTFEWGIQLMVQNKNVVWIHKNPVDRN